MAVNRLWVRLRAITLTLLRGLDHRMQSLLGEDPNTQLAHQGDRLSPPASPPLSHAQHVIRQTSNPCTNVKVLLISFSSLSVWLWAWWLRHSWLPVMGAGDASVCWQALFLKQLPSTASEPLLPLHSVTWERGDPNQYLVPPEKTSSQRLCFPCPLSPLLQLVGKSQEIILVKHSGCFLQTRASQAFIPSSSSSSIIIITAISS